MFYLGFLSIYVELVDGASCTIQSRLQADPGSEAKVNYPPLSPLPLQLRLPQPRPRSRSIWFLAKLTVMLVPIRVGNATVSWVFLTSKRKGKGQVLLLRSQALVQSCSLCVTTVRQFVVDCRSTLFQVADM